MSRHRETAPDPRATGGVPARPDPLPDAEPAADPPASAPEVCAASAAPPELGSDAGQPVPSADELAALRAQADLAEQRWDRLLRLQAEFDNYRKRVERDRDEARLRATEDLMQDLLPVLDHFELGLTTPASSVDGAVLMTGMRLIQRQLHQVLERAGLRQLDASGQRFDPNIHEAVGCVPTRDAPEGTIVEQVRNGYCLHERLLRPAGVRVAVAPPDPDGARATREQGGDAPTVEADEAGV